MKTKTIMFLEQNMQFIRSTFVWMSVTQTVPMDAIHKEP